MEDHDCSSLMPGSLLALLSMQEGGFQQLTGMQVIQCEIVSQANIMNRQWSF